MFRYEDRQWIRKLPKLSYLKVADRVQASIRQQREPCVGSADIAKQNRPSELGACCTLLAPIKPFLPTDCSPYVTKFSLPVDQTLFEIKRLATFQRTAR
jgi:hypothetical protein